MNPKSLAKPIISEPSSLIPEPSSLELVQVEGVLERMARERVPFNGETTRILRSRGFRV